MKHLHFRKIAIGLVAATLAFGTTLPQASAATEYDSIVLNIGANELERNLVWYAPTSVPADQQTALVIEKDAPGAVEQVFTPIQSDAALKPGFNYFHTTINGLKPGTTYEYRVGSMDDGYSETYEFTTAVSDNETTIAAFGDPQIGAGDTPSDSVGWQSTLDLVQQENPNLDFLITLGDQVNTANDEEQYQEFVAPDQLRSFALAPNVGNHDNGSAAYGEHFYTPNQSDTAGVIPDREGLGDYWYIYNNTLFLSFNDNNRDDEAHFAWAQQVIDEYGDGTNWQIATMHHGPFSTASHTHDGDIIARRGNWPTAMSQMGVDLVLGGHDHIYSRSHLINDGWPVGDLSAPATLEKFDDEVLWLTLNSGSGSKFYTEQFYKTDQPFPYNAVTEQTRTPNYSIVDITDESIRVVTKTVDGDLVDDVTIENAPEGAQQTQPPQGAAPTDFRTATAGERPVPNTVDDQGVTHVEGRILHGNDDVEQSTFDGFMYMDSSDLELTYDGIDKQAVGLRFDALQIPKGATITSAYIQFTVDEPNKSQGDADLTIAVEDSTNAEKYVEFTDNDVTRRSYSDQTVQWKPQPWTERQTAGEAQRTPDLSELVQGIIDQDGWTRGNALAFAVTGEGIRSAESYEGGESAEAAKLIVEYTLDNDAQELYLPLAAAADDLEEHPADKSLDVDSSDIELGYENEEAQLVGLRYDLDIPAGATIEEAYLQFTVDDAENSLDPFNVKIQAAAEDDVDAFVYEDGSLSAFDRTEASVTWDDAPLWTLDQEQRSAQRSPNVASVIQEIVNRDGWAAGNGLALLIEGDGVRSAESVEGGGVEEAAHLYVRWSMPDEAEPEPDQEPAPDQDQEPAPDQDQDQEPDQAQENRETTVDASRIALTDWRTNAWGYTTPGSTVRTQVMVPGQGWSQSQVRTATSTGYYQIPLTYGFNTRGPRTWRVVVTHPNGELEVTKTFTQTRRARPTVNHVDVKPYRESTFVWGTVDHGNVPAQVYTQVWVPGKGWSVSQKGQSRTSDGFYAVELTYGKGYKGTYRFRLVSVYDEIGTLYSEPFEVVRR